MDFFLYDLVREKPGLIWLVAYCVILYPVILVNLLYVIGILCFFIVLIFLPFYPKSWKKKIGEKADNRDDVDNKNNKTLTLVDLLPKKLAPALPYLFMDRAIVFKLQKGFLKLYITHILGIGKLAQAGIDGYARGKRKAGGGEIRKIEDAWLSPWLAPLYWIIFYPILVFLFVFINFLISPPLIIFILLLWSIIY